MPDVKIAIGGRDFDVACQPGEEHFLRAAAKLLDGEAQTLVGQLGRMPESRMLLMAGLLLADRTAELEDRLRAAERKLAEAPGAPEPVRIEVPVIPAAVIETMAELAARAEAIAQQYEDRIGA